jgi:hypothetical protein
MSSGRYIFRGYAQQGWRAASYALANSGAAPVPAAVVTTRLVLVGTSQQRMGIEGTSRERLATIGTSGRRLDLIGSSE